MRTLGPAAPVGRASCVGIVAGILFVASVAIGAAFPRPTGYVNDVANALDASARADLDAMLRGVEQRTSAEVVLVTVPSLDGMSVEEYANKLFKAWGIGKKAADNGVLVVVAPGARSMRIEVGYGLEPVLPDGLAGEIIRTQFLPRFREGNYAAGIADGMRRIVSLVERRHVLTVAERARFAPPVPDPWTLLPFYALAVAMGAFVLGVGVQTHTVLASVLGLPVMVGPMFIGAGLFLVPAAATLVPVGLAAYLAGFRAGRRRSWRTALRGTDEALTSRWVVGGGDPPPPASGAGSDGSSAGGSSSGGLSGELRRWFVRWRRGQRTVVGRLGRASPVGTYVNAQRKAARAIGSGTACGPSNSW